MDQIRHKHIPELQTLRGIAAAAVAITHFMDGYDLPAAFYRVSDVLFNAHAAVIMFFVLSGYVLSPSLIRQPIRTPVLASFYVRRVFRIYPALAATLLMTLAIALCLPAPADSPLSAFLLKSEVNMTNIVRYLSGMDTYLSPATWTIFAEVGGSLCLPCFVYVARLNRWTLPFLLILLCGCAHFFNGAQHGFYFVSFLIYFAIGMSVFFAPAEFHAFTARQARIIACIALASLLSVRYFWFLLIHGTWQSLGAQYGATVPALAEGISACLLIEAVAHMSGQFNWLSKGPLAALGDVSYSLFLLNFPVTVLFGRLLYPLTAITPQTNHLWPFLIVSLVEVPILIFLSFAMYRYVEIPGMGLGKRIVEATDRRKPAGP